MSPPLDNLSGPGKPLKAEAPDAAETAGLLRTGLARLADSRNTSLALESRFDQGMLCITLARMWQCGSGWDARRFLQPIAPLLARKPTPQTARGRAATDRRELCRASLTYNAAHALCLAALRGKALPRQQPLHRVPGAAPHAGPWPRGVARAGQVPQHPQPGRVRRLAGCGRAAGGRSDQRHAGGGKCDAAMIRNCYLFSSF